MLQTTYGTSQNIFFLTGPSGKKNEILCTEVRHFPDALTSCSWQELSTPTFTPTMRNKAALEGCSNKNAFHGIRKRQRAPICGTFILRLIPRSGYLPTSKHSPNPTNVTEKQQTWP